jgi:hypothetical protein
MRALQQSTLLTLASRATTSHPSPASRAALLAPLYGVYNLQLEMDEAVLLFPCGMLAFYYLSKVCLGKCFASLWSGTASRLSGSFGSSKRLVAPDVNGLSGFDGLSAEEESIRQVARRPPRPLPPSRIYAPTRVAHPGDAPPRPAAPPPRPAAPPPRPPAAPPRKGSKRPARARQYPHVPRRSDDAGAAPRPCPGRCRRRREARPARTGTTSITTGRLPRRQAS